MHARGVAAKWQSRRKISLGPVRRACPASGATWNVQVVCVIVFIYFFLFSVLNEIWEFSMRFVNKYAMNRYSFG